MPDQALWCQTASPLCEVRCTRPSTAVSLAPFRTEGAPAVLLCLGRGSWWGAATVDLAPRDPVLHLIRGPQLRCYPPFSLMRSSLRERGRRTNRLAYAVRSVEHVPGAQPAR